MRVRIHGANSHDALQVFGRLLPRRRQLLAVPAPAHPLRRLM
jgi:hypothetical protein